MSVSQPLPNQSTLSATNFDLPSLHLLRPELEVSLHDAEVHLSQFTDDSTTHAPLLLDSQETLSQVAKVLGLISLTGANTLAQVLSDGFGYLYQQRDSHTSDSEALHGLIMDLSEGIMTLTRYIEFVLLKQTVAPALLLPVINLLQNSLGQPASTADTFTTNNKSIVIPNPQANFHSLNELGINDHVLIDAYRAGLAVALKATTPPTDTTDIQKLQAMSAACQAVSQRSQSLFWQAAAAATQDIAHALPLSLRQKRALIYVEQQFNQYLPLQDSRFADLVGFAAARNTPLSGSVQHTLDTLSADTSQHPQMKQFLFGPNREVTDTLNQIIQEDIDQIKHLTDSYAREERTTTDPEVISNISERLHNLSLVFKTLNLPHASDSLTQQVAIVKNWQQPTSEDFDSLLSSLMVAENATISLAKSHTPGAATTSLNNQNISLHQLDTAYATLLRESRTTIATIEAAISDYIADSNKDILHLINLPEMLHNVAGATMFLKMPQSHQLLKRTSTHLQQLLQNSTPISDTQLTKIADIVMSVDYYLESLENNKPAGTQAIKVGQKSLQQLMVA